VRSIDTEGPAADLAGKAQATLVSSQRCMGSNMVIIESNVRHLLHRSLATL